jgi:hypothetical protein
MSEAPRRSLSGEEIVALKFAANRQLTRWANKPRLSEYEHAQRAALRRAARVLQNSAFAHGCELRPRRSGDGR